jgi:hypothetical protein
MRIDLREYQPQQIRAGQKIHPPPRSLDPVDEALGGFAPKFDPAPKLQNLHTNYERLLRQAEDFQQPLGNRVRQEEDKVPERQGSYHHHNHGLSLFPS